MIFYNRWKLIDSILVLIAVGFAVAYFVFDGLTFKDKAVLFYLPFTILLVLSKIKGGRWLPGLTYAMFGFILYTYFDNLTSQWADLPDIGDLSWGQSLYFILPLFAYGFLFKRTTRLLSVYTLFYFIISFYIVFIYLSDFSVEESLFAYFSSYGFEYTRIVCSVIFIPVFLIYAILQPVFADFKPHRKKAGKPIYEGDASYYSGSGQDYDESEDHDSGIIGYSNHESDAEEQNRRYELERESDWLRARGASRHSINAVDDELGRWGSERDYEDRKHGYGDDD